MAKDKAEKPAPSAEAPKAENKQRPTVGRIVNFNVASDKGQPYPAVVTHVWNDECVNLNVFGDGSFVAHTGGPRTSVRFSEKGEAGTWNWPARV